MSNKEEEINNVISGRAGSVDLKKFARWEDEISSPYKVLFNLISAETWLLEVKGIKNVTTSDMVSFLRNHENIMKRDIGETANLAAIGPFKSDHVWLNRSGTFAIASTVLPNRKEHLEEFEKALKKSKENGYFEDTDRELSKIDRRITRKKVGKVKSESAPSPVKVRNRKNPRLAAFLKEQTWSSYITIEVAVDTLVNSLPRAVDSSCRDSVVRSVARRLPAIWRSEYPETEIPTIGDTVVLRSGATITTNKKYAYPARFLAAHLPDCVEQYHEKHEKKLTPEEYDYVLCLLSFIKDTIKGKN